MLSKHKEKYSEMISNSNTNTANTQNLSGLSISAAWIQNNNNNET